MIGLGSDKNAMVEFDKQVLASFIDIFAKNFVSYSEREFAKNLSGTMICSISLVFSREFKDWHLQWDNEYSTTVGHILTIFLTDPHEISIPMNW